MQTFKELYLEESIVRIPLGDYDKAQNAYSSAVKKMRHIADSLVKIDTDGTIIFDCKTPSEAQSIKGLFGAL